jgi:hypothetical protein
VIRKWVAFRQESNPFFGFTAGHERLRYSDAVTGEPEPPLQHPSLTRGEKILKNLLQAVKRRPKLAVYLFPYVSS